LPVPLLAADVAAIAAQDRVYRAQARAAAVPRDYIQPTEEELREEAAWLARQPPFAAKGDGREARALSHAHSHGHMHTSTRRHALTD
jgi:hypothetical protein